MKNLKEQSKSYLDILKEARILDCMIMCNKIFRHFDLGEDAEFLFDLDDVYDEEDIRAGKDFYSFIEEEIMQIFIINPGFDENIVNKYGLYLAYIQDIDIYLLLVDHSGMHWSVVFKEPNHSFKI